jgi:hypothetical protein
MPEPTPEEDLLETIDELYGAARSAVLDAARAWRIGGGAPWTVKALVAAIDALASAEALLGVAYDAPPAMARDASRRTSPRPTRTAKARPTGGQGRSRPRS